MFNLGGLRFGLQLVEQVLPSKGDWKPWGRGRVITLVRSDHEAEQSQPCPASKTHALLRSRRHSRALRLESDAKHGLTGIGIREWGLDQVPASVDRLPGISVAMRARVLKVGAEKRRARKLPKRNVLLLSA